jgi:hypothetical protein
LSIKRRPAKDRHGGARNDIGKSFHNVEGLCGRAADRLQDDRADGDVRNETAIHHINMDPVRAGGVDGTNFFT